MEIIKVDNTETLKREIKKSAKPIIVQGLDEKFNRKALEYGKFDVLLSVEPKENGALRQVNSGLNEIMARIAKKNNVAIGFDFNEIKNGNKEEKAEILSKIRQNIRICRKTGVKIKVLNYNDKIDSNSLLLSLGASTGQLKEAMSF